jgi:hypothetical protein
MVSREWPPRAWKYAMIRARSRAAERRVRTFVYGEPTISGAWTYDETFYDNWRRDTPPRER